jgi:hypothetical protein
MITNKKNTYKDYFSANKFPEIVKYAGATYISIIGHGYPGTSIFYQKKKALSDFCIELRRSLLNTSKTFDNDIIEIFYWFDESSTGLVDIGRFYTTVDLELLNYRISIRIPETISDDDIQLVSTSVKNNAFAKMFELYYYIAGDCVQVLHEGPFAGELETLPILQKFADDNHFVKIGMHHEIHLVHFERGQDQDNLKTILRDQVRKI